MACTLNVKINLFLGSLTNSIILYLIFVLLKSKKVNKSQFIPDYIFCGLTLLSASLYLNANIYRCSSSDTTTPIIIESIGEAFYAIQYLLLFILLFHRLCIVFKKTRYYIQQSIIVIFYLIFFTLICAGIGSILLRQGAFN